MPECAAHFFTGKTMIMPVRPCSLRCSWSKLRQYIHLAWTKFFKNGTIEFESRLGSLFRVSWQHHIPNFMYFFRELKNIDSSCQNIRLCAGSCSFLKLLFLIKEMLLENDEKSIKMTKTMKIQWKSMKNTTF